MSIINYKNDVDKVMFDMILKRFAPFLLGNDRGDEYFNLYARLSCKLKHIKFIDKDNEEDNNLLKNDEFGGLMIINNGTDFNIYLRSISDFPEEKQVYLFQEITHELMHGFSNLLFHYDYYNEHQYVYDDMYFKSAFCGTIYKKNTNNEMKKYGLALTEAATDISTQLFLISQFKNIFNKNNVSVDLLLENTESKNLHKSRYAYFEPITKLMIQACENIPNTTYEDILNANESIYRLNACNTHGVIHKNDYLYSLMFNPFYIENKYNKLMGKDKYEKFNIKLDELFELSNKYNIYDEVSSNTMMELCNNLRDFFDKKLENDLKMNLCTEEEKDILKDKFYKLYDKVINYYDSYNKTKDSNYYNVFSK